MIRRGCRCGFHSNVSCVGEIVKNVMFGMLMLLVAGCLGHPKKVKPVQKFDLTKYLGKWHEIARLDHSFERGLERVSAEYSPRKGGGIVVKNRGYSVSDKRWKEATGKAFFVREPTEGYLKVSFFGPFYGSYIVFYLDAEYQHAFVCGPDESYLWLLSRTPVVAKEVLDRFVRKARALGFATEELIYVNQKK